MYGHVVHVLSINILPVVVRIGNQNYKKEAG
nr:MAG TPA: hypothetical protein [Caudoviricetes sp.]